MRNHWMRLALTVCALLWPGLAHAQLYNWSGITLSPSGRPVSASIAVCNFAPGLATTGAQVTANVAILTMASNPITAGFVANQQIIVSGFTGGDTYFNGGSIANGIISGGFTILSVTSTQITYALIHANASASSNGSAFQGGSAAQACAPLASIFSDPAGATPITQPGLTSSGIGNVGFYVNPGSYAVLYYGSGVVPQIQPLTVTFALTNGNNTFTGNNNLVPVFNVLSPAYGAVGNGSTDDTAAVQAAVTAAAAAGGVVYFPGNGHKYALNGAIQAACDAIICLPSVSATAPQTIRIVGDGRMRQDAQINGGSGFTNGTIILSTQATGTDGSSAVFGVPQVVANNNGLDNLEAYFSDLTFITYANPKIGCINMFFAEGGATERVHCSNGENYPAAGSHTQPTNQRYGIIYPGLNNDTVSSAKHTQVSGYYTGIWASEHFHCGEAVWTAFGIYGYEFGQAFHPITGTCGSEENASFINASAAATPGGAAQASQPIPIDLILRNEIDPTNSFNCTASWCYSTTDVNDANNNLTGKIEYNTIEATVGHTTAFPMPSRVNGGTGVTFFDMYSRVWTFSGAFRALGGNYTLGSPGGSSLTLLNAQANAGAITGNSSAQTVYTYTLPASTVANLKAIRVTAGLVHTGAASVSYVLSLNGQTLSSFSSALANIVVNDTVLNITTTTGTNNSVIFGQTSVVASGAGPLTGLAWNSAQALTLTFNVANTDSVTPIQWLVELIQ